MDRGGGGEFGGITKPAPAVPPGFLRIASLSPRSTLTLRMGPNAPQETGGSGGWVLVPRPGRQPLSVWEGGVEVGLVLDLLLDGWIANRSVEPELARLRRLARALPGEPHTPIVSVAGNCPRTDLEYVIVDLAERQGETEWKDNRRVRVGLDVILTQYVPGRTLQIAKPATSVKAQLYRVRKGDNLRTIATKLLGSADRWREIAALSGLTTWRLPSSLIGKYVKVPPR